MIDLNVEICSIPTIENVLDTSGTREPSFVHSVNKNKNHTVFKC